MKLQAVSRKSYPLSPKSKNWRGGGGWGGGVPVTRVVLGTDYQFLHPKIRSCCLKKEAERGHAPRYPCAKEDPLLAGSWVVKSRFIRTLHETRSKSPLTYFSRGGSGCSKMPRIDRGRAKMIVLFDTIG